MTLLRHPRWDLGIDLADEDLLNHLYDRRSAVAHGSRGGDLDSETRSEYLTLERLLRAILRRSILDSGVAAWFVDAKTIREKWLVY